MTLALLSYAEKYGLLNSTLAVMTDTEPEKIRSQTRALEVAGWLEVVDLERPEGSGRPGCVYDIGREGKTILKQFRKARHDRAGAARLKGNVYAQMRIHFPLINLPLLALVESVESGAASPKTLEQELGLTYAQLYYILKRATNHKLVTRSKNDKVKVTAKGRKLLDLAGRI